MAPTALLASLLLTACAGSSVLDATQATWAGRTLSSPSNVSFSWEGVQAAFSVSGATSISVQASSTCPGCGLFHTLVDGSLLFNWTLCSTGGSPRSVQVATGLSPGAHTVVLWYATDPIAVSWDKLPPWSHSFHTLSSDGQLLAGPARPQRRLQIIGDSITAGNQIDPESCADDHLGTYGARLCQHYDADCQTLAVSGKGLYVNCCDDNVTMTELYKRTIVSLPETVYDNAQFVPDAVVLALGTNDQGHNTGPAWVANFTRAYADFLVELTVAHSNSKLPIFCIVGPITHDYYPWVADAIALSGVSGAVVVNMTTPVDRCGHPPWDSHRMVRGRAGARAAPAAHCTRTHTLLKCPSAHTPLTQMFEQMQPTVAAVLGW